MWTPSDGAPALTLRLAMVSSYPELGAEPAGGVEVSTRRLVRALTAAGAEVTVVAPGPSSDVRDGPVRVIHVDSDSRLALLRRLRPWREAAGRVLQELEPDVVHGQGLLASGLAVTDLRGLPRIVTAHGNHAQDTRAWRRRGLGAEARIAVVERLSAGVVARADVVVSVHPEAAVNVPGHPRRFVHIPTILDPVFARPGERPPVPGRVLYCGGARRIKGWDLLATAWDGVQAAVPDATLHVVGWSDSEPLPVGFRTARVEGWLAADELREAFADAAVVVIPSRFEVAPVTLLDAWAVGVPVVATRTGGLPGLAGGAAILVDASSAALGEALTQVLSGASPTAALVAEGARRAAAATPERVAQAHLALYSELLS
jgi:glycosyltransferase involved in cell wall biosynthesis